MWLLHLLIVAYLPGALIFRMPLLGRERRASLPADERLYWAVLLSVAWSCGLVFLLAVLERYLFQRLLVANLLFAAATLGLWRSRLLYRGTAPRLTVAALWPALLVAAALWSYVPGSEWVVGGRDPGVYVNEGVQIAQRGSLIVHDATVASVPPQFRDLFFPSHHASTYYGTRFMGFFLLDPGTGDVVGQFPHLFPASVAIGYALQGLSGVRTATAAWAMLGLLGTYFLGTRLFGRLAGGVAATLLLLNVIQLWYAKYPNSEMLSQAIILAALLAVVRAMHDRDPFFGPVAGALCGLVLFARFDGVLVIGGVWAALAIAPLIGATIGVAFWLVLVPLIGLALLYLATVVAPYGQLAIGLVVNNRGPLLALAVAGAVVALAVRWVSRRPRLRAWPTTVIPPLAAVAVGALATYAYVFRHSAGALAVHDAEAFRTFAWYVTVPGLFLAVAGVVAFSVRGFWRAPAFVAALDVSAVFFFYKVRIIPEHFWMARRFLPLVLPGALVMIGGLATWWGAPGVPAATQASRVRVRLRCLGPAAAVLAGLGLGWLFWQQSRPLIRHVEYAGLIPRIEQLAARFGDHDLILVESRASASDMHVFALPLAYIYTKPVLVLASPRPDKTALADFLAWARQRYRHVFFLGGGGTDLLSRRIDATPVASERFQVPVWDAPVNAYPAGPRMKEFDFGLYLIGGSPARTGTFSLDVGSWDDLNAVRFYAKERGRDGVPFRWTRNQSYLALPGIAESTQRITLWLANGGRPPQLGPCTVEVLLDDVPIGQLTVGATIEPHTMTIPPSLVQRLAAADEPGRLMIRTRTWNPRKALGVPDDRDLGVMVTRVEMR
jgi:hypothetical protein